MLTAFFLLFGATPSSSFLISLSLRTSESSATILLSSLISTSILLSLLSASKSFKSASFAAYASTFNVDVSVPAAVDVVVGAAVVMVWESGSLDIVLDVVWVAFAFVLVSAAGAVEVEQLVSLQFCVCCFVVVLLLAVVVVVVVVVLVLVVVVVAVLSAGVLSVEAFSASSFDLVVVEAWVAVSESWLGSLVGSPDFSPSFFFWISGRGSSAAAGVTSFFSDSFSLLRGFVSGAAAVSSPFESSPLTSSCPARAEKAWILGMAHSPSASPE